MSIKPSQHSAHLEDHDEGYFASFTDLLVGILFIFIIMMMMFATNSQKPEDVTKVLSKINEARKQVLEEMQKSLKSEGVNVTIDIENGVLRLPESMLFESGKWEPNERGDVALKRLANVLMTYLPCLSYADPSLKFTCQKMHLIKMPMLETVLIEGHTDSKPYRSEKGLDSNWGLSANRAITIFNRLTAYRPELEKSIMNSHRVSVLGVSAYAAKRPVSNYNLEKNRRIDLRFIMKSPTPEDIEKIKKELKSG